MAILNGVEGLAHADASETNWKGYILVPPDVRNLSWFPIFPVEKATVVYEGPIYKDGKFFHAHGKVRILKTKYTPKEFRVDFIAVEVLVSTKEYASKPNDYLM